MFALIAHFVKEGGNITINHFLNLSSIEFMGFNMCCIMLTIP